MGGEEKGWKKEGLLAKRDGHGLGEGAMVNGSWGGVLCLGGEGEEKQDTVKGNWSGGKNRINKKERRGEERRVD